MGSDHLDDVLAEAVDGLLDPVSARRVDAHLATCAACRRALDEQRGAVRLLREMPPARMPRPIVLPSCPPSVEPSPGRSPVSSLGGWWAGLAGRAAGLRRPRPLIGLLGVMAIATAAVVLGLRVGHQGTASTASVPSLGHRPARLPAAVTTRSIGCTGGGYAVAVPASGVAPPPQFSVATTVPSATGTLVLATERSTYHPGDTILVYARVVPGAGGTRTALVPCVSLVVERGAPARSGSAVVDGSGGPEASGPGPAVAGGGRGAGASSAPGPLGLAVPLVVATPTQGADAVVLLELVVPPSVSPGSILDLVALPPEGGEPTPGGAAILRLWVAP